jgi:glycosyltransferase involved in cell wall biosynthesis
MPLLSATAKNLLVKRVAAHRNVVWELRELARQATKERADAVLTLREIVGFGGPPTLMHVAEPPAYRLQRGVTGRRARFIAKDALLQAMLRGSVLRAACVTAASEATAIWLRDRYRIEPQVIPPGIDPFFLEALEPGDPHPRYFLHAASGDLRDNTELVFTSFAEAGLAGEGVRLVLVGTSSSEQERLGHLASTLGIADSVSFDGWVTDTRLRELYRDAIALVQPSRYEGFAGLQPLEAMALGTPVVALDAPGVTEALGSAAELVPPDRPELLPIALRNVAENEVLRARLGQAGRAKAQGFTWERAAAAFVEVLEKIA